MKLKEAVRLGGLYAFLEKERGLGLQGTINSGEVTRKYMGEGMEDRGYFKKVYLCKFTLMFTPIFDKNHSSLPGTGLGKGTFFKEKFMLCF